MRLSTSTLGCYEWDLATCIERISGYGFDGIDFRGLQGTLALWELPEFSANLATSACQIQDAGLEVSCVSSGIRLTDREAKTVQAFDEELLKTAEICVALGCKQIRVFGGELAHYSSSNSSLLRAEAITYMVERAHRMAEAARSFGNIELVIETHDDWSASADMAELLTRIDHPRVGCCWDVKHTWWIGDETANTSWQRLRCWIRNTHWKDARRVDFSTLGGDNASLAACLKMSGMLCPMGLGSAPLGDAIDLLMHEPYKEGWYTLEWERHWHPHIEAASIAFPGFIRYMQEAKQRYGR